MTIDGFGLLLLALYALSVMRLTRLINKDTVLDPIRIHIVRAFGEQSTLVYFLTCPWCVGMWLSIATAWVPILALDWDWWLYPLIALALSQIIGLAAALDGEEIDIEIEDE